MSRDHHSCKCHKSCKSCPSEQEEIVDRILSRCCPERRPEALLPIELSPEEVLRLRCLLDCLCRCLCSPFDNFPRTAGAEDFSRTAGVENFLRRR